MMDDKQLLDAIRGIVQEETGRIVDEKLTANNEALMQRVDTSIDEKLAANNKVLVDRVNVVVENKYDEILKLLREDYTPIRERVAEFSDYSQVKSQVADHDRALQGQRKEIDELKKKAI